MRRPATGVLLLLAGCASPPPAPAPVESVSVLRDTTTFSTGPLRLVRGGRSDTMAVEAIRAWRLADGAEVGWSARDGGGGFENEGEAFRLATPDSMMTPRLLVRETFPILAVEELRDGEGRRLLALVMADGGAGLPHLALVDPARGTVYRATRARLAERGDTLTIEHLEGEGSALPSIIEQVTIRELLGRPLLPR